MLKFIETKDKSFTLFHTELNETYHSIHGAISESQYVFIKHGLNYFCDTKRQDSVSILEIGFGTGLNALLSFLFCEEKKCSLVFKSVEPFPLPLSIIKKINYVELLQLNEQQIRAFLTIHQSGKLLLNKKDYSIKAELIYKPYQQSNIQTKADIIYFDAFAPNKQPDIWHPDVLQKCFNDLNPNGLLLTYCAKGEVKRSLKSVGFNVETLDGPPGKREMIRAYKSI